MEFLLNRYRNLSVLLAAILAQLVLLAYQVKSNGEVRLIRVWAVGAVTPMARVIETCRSSASHFFRDYFVLLGVREENKRMKAELDRIKMENQYLRTELSTADRAKSLSIFQTRSPSKMVAAHIIGNTPGPGAQVVIIDRGTSSGIENGMAVITPDGIVGKVVSVFPMASEVLLVTDQTFAAGVISQKNRVRGTLRGKGQSKVQVEHVQNEEKLEQGEWFYTSGDDRIFPKGLPVGEATVVRQGKTDKEIYVVPSGFQNGLEEVLIIIEGVHMEIPSLPATTEPVHLMPLPPGDTGAAPVSVVPTQSAPTQNAPAQNVPAQNSTLSTDADRIVEQYRKIGQEQKHLYGERGSGAPNYNAAPSATPPKPPETKPSNPGKPNP